ncbi:MAG: hypothetical protein PQJ49_11200 [Sphaerochaetaceae bacterium]|nr:hypothetical protein [Sphaerochaetaceae bacterium]
MKIRLKKSKKQCSNNLNKVICPYCGESIIEGLNKEVSNDVEKSHIFDCPNCGLEFSVLREVRFYFNSKPLSSTDNFTKKIDFKIGDECELRRAFDNKDKSSLRDAGIEIVNKN